MIIPSLSLAEEALAAGELLLGCGRAVPRGEAGGLGGLPEERGEARAAPPQVPPPGRNFPCLSLCPLILSQCQPDPLNIYFWDLRPVTVLPDQAWKRIFSFSRFFKGFQFL